MLTFRMAVPTDVMRQKRPSRRQRFARLETPQGRGYSSAVQLLAAIGAPPMVEPKIRFDDGAAYEEIMGVWSRFAGEIFLDWLSPPSGLRWVDMVAATGPSLNFW